MKIFKIMAWILILLPFFSPFLEGEFKTPEELERELINSSGTESVKILLELGDLYREANPEKSIYMGSKALEISSNLKYEQGRALAYMVLARAVIQSGKSRDALEFAKKSEEIFKKKGDKKGLLQTKLTRAYVHFIDTEYPESLRLYLQARYEIEAMENVYDEQVEIVKFMGIIYSRQGDYDSAFSLYLEGSALAERSKNPADIAFFYNQLALIEDSRKNTGVALVYFRKSKKIFSDLKMIRKAAIVEMNIANCLSNPRQALVHLQSALEKFKSLHEEEYTWRTLYFMGNRHRTIQQYQDAEGCYRQALGISDHLNRRELQTLLYKGFSELYEETGRFPEALDWHKKYMAEKEKVVNEKKNREITRWQEKFNTEKKELENLDLRRKNQVQLILFISGFLLLSSILTLILKKFFYLFAFWKKEKYIGQYRILERIGAGGMGVVYKAHNIRDKSSFVAIKVLKEEQTRLESNVKRFKREGMIVDRLDHPNILKVFERGEHAGRLYIAMEYLQGKTLDQLIIDEGPLPVPLCLHVMRQISGALAMIHRERIVHRDLKPANIMLIEKKGDPYFVKLLDFGLSKVWYHSRVTESGILVGTLSYQAPEQVSLQEFSPASDIYSLGLIFYEILSGKHFFEGESMSTVVEKIIQSNPVPLSEIRIDIPYDLNRLVTEMLEKNPQQRPSIDRIVEMLRRIKRTGDLDADQGKHK